ncbi:MAG: flavodoxin [bacterium]|nr:MAG: flavodoxin [bacterium]
MKKTALLYWVKGGNVERAARIIYQQFNAETIDLFALDEFDVSKTNDYDLLILGSSTVGAEHWEDATNDNKWNEFFRTVQKTDLSNITFATFGLGNQVLYPNHFADGLGYFHEEITKTNAKMIGKWPTEGYQFTDSEGAHDGLFYGLALDADNEPEKTEGRAQKWVAQLKKEMGM